MQQRFSCKLLFKIVTFGGVLLLGIYSFLNRIFTLCSISFWKCWPFLKILQVWCKYFFNSLFHCLRRLIFCFWEIYTHIFYSLIVVIKLVECQYWLSMTANLQWNNYLQVKHYDSASNESENQNYWIWTSICNIYLQLNIVLTESHLYSELIQSFLL